MFEEEAVAEALIYVWTHTATGQHCVDDSLRQRQLHSHFSGIGFQNVIMILYKRLMVKKSAT